ncbi:MAG: hypothetical protein ACREE0_13610 [Phenylobacterium sp.]
MNWSERLRQVHRWVSMAFTAGVVVNTVAVVQGKPAAWMYLLALVPLFVLLATGLYLFARPYAARWRTARALPRA